MLENVPISGLAICYGPLALTIIGFIVFAVLTDAHARRTYLRRLDPRAEDERPPLTPLPVMAQVDTETPAGFEVTLMPDSPPPPPTTRTRKTTPRRAAAKPAPKKPATAAQEAAQDSTADSSAEPGKTDEDKDSSGG